jgi:hypothetical protein
MGEESPRTGLSRQEHAYLRAIEDRFARLRGTPFLLRPKDMALMRRWWADGIPLIAVLAGMQEVFERRAEAGNDPVSSLAYCGHAVARHARRLRRTAPSETEGGGIDVGAALAELVAEIERSGREWEAVPALADGLRALADAIATVPTDAEPVAVDEALARLEIGGLEALEGSLPPEQGARVADAVAAATASLGDDAATRRRTERAVRLRTLREVLGVPRLELASVARHD